MAHKLKNVPKSELAFNEEYSLGEQHGKSEVAFCRLTFQPSRRSK